MPKWTAPDLFTCVHPHPTDFMAVHLGDKSMPKFNDNVFNTVVHTLPVLRGVKFIKHGYNSPLVSILFDLTYQGVPHTHNYVYTPQEATIPNFEQIAISVALGLAHKYKLTCHTAKDILIGGVKTYLADYHDENMQMAMSSPITAIPQLSKNLPGMDTPIQKIGQAGAIPKDCQSYCAFWSHKPEGTLWAYIQHLNDDHQMSRNEIADWLDDLHDRGIINIEFEPWKDETNAADKHSAEGAGNQG